MARTWRIASAASWGAAWLCGDSGAAAPIGKFSQVLAFNRRPERREAVNLPSALCHWNVVFGKWRHGDGRPLRD